jgi:hypothetical protein
VLVKKQQAAELYKGINMLGLKEVDYYILHRQSLLAWLN